ncbi:hypothetical protein BLNAU_13792 [Blattamonas nauphoetae]|uniref:Uncharacterized protein n=1 Tax=Blattamonas nauphoetae TaxID=2049346 RepID=A0ABQ9XIP0_9EUKA|nr:hypothetical protein BLNAU_13792 [Blattamonas nauphoetae]
MSDKAVGSRNKHLGCRWGIKHIRAERKVGERERDQESEENGLAEQDTEITPPSLLDVHDENEEPKI